MSTAAEVLEDFNVPLVDDNPVNASVFLDVLLDTLGGEVQRAWADLGPMDQQDVVRILRQKVAAAKEADPLGAWWHDLTDQQRSFALLNKPLKLLAGGNRSGKTWTGAGIVATIFTGDYPEDWPERWTFDPDEPRYLWVCVVDRNVQVEPGGAQDTLLKLLPPGSIKRIQRIYGNVISIIEGHDGSKIIFKAYGAGQEVFQSAGVHVKWWDEEPPRKQFMEGYQRGIEVDSVDLLTMTPVNGITWLYTELVKTGKMPVRFIETADNPAVDEDRLDERDQILTEVEKMVRRSGRFLPLVGSPRFDLRPLSEALAMADDPPAWMILDESPDGPLEPPIVREAHEFDYRPMAMYVDPRGREKWRDRWVIGVDTSEGKPESTECALVVWDRYLQCVAAAIHGLWDPEEWTKLVMRVGRFYHDAYVCPEANNMGIMVVRDLARDYGVLYVREKSQTTTEDLAEEFGFWTNNASKSRIEAQAISKLKKAGNDGMVDLSYPPLVSQCMTYQRQNTGTGKAASGTMDDLVLAFMLALEMARQAPPMRDPTWQKRIDEKRKVREARRRAQRRDEGRTWMSN